MPISTLKHEIHAEKGSLAQAYRPTKKIQFQSTVEPGFCLMDRVFKDSLMLLFFLKILN